jgi:hypothetical protein
LRSCFDHIYSSQFCGAKAADFAIALQCTTAVLMEARDSIDNIVIDNDQLLRRLLSGMTEDSILLIVVQTTEASSTVEQQLKVKLLELREIMPNEVSDCFLHCMSF